MGGGCLFREGVMGALFEGRCVLFFLTKGCLSFSKVCFCQRSGWCFLIKVLSVNKRDGCFFEGVMGLFVERVAGAFCQKVGRWFLLKG